MVYKTITALLVGALAGAAVANELSYDRSKIVVTDKSPQQDYIHPQSIAAKRNLDRSKHLYKVFRRNDKIIFRRIWYEGNEMNSPAFVNLVGSVENGFERADQSAPIRGLGMITVREDTSYWDKCKSNFESALKEYKKGDKEK